MIPLCLFPVMKYLVLVAVNDRLPAGNLLLDLVPFACPTRTAPVIEVREINFGFMHHGHNPFTPPLIACFYDHMPAPQILKPLGERSSTIKRRRDLLGIGTR